MVYHHDYYVRMHPETKEKQCIYYNTLCNNNSSLPDILQVAKHHFVEIKLAEMWRYNMLFAW